MIAPGLFVLIALALIVLIQVAMDRRDDRRREEELEAEREVARLLGLRWMRDDR